MHLSKNQINYITSLSRKKVREEEQKFVLEGWHALEEALKSNFTIELIAATMESASKHKDMLASAREQAIRVFEITETQLAKISETVNSQGVIAVVHQRHWSIDEIPLDKGKMVVACERINDPGNLGTIIRTCDWFGTDAILLSDGSVSLYNEKVVRSTAGSIFHIPIIENVHLENSLPQLQQFGWKLCITVLDGDSSIITFHYPDKTILVFGSEAHGISKPLVEIADFRITIPAYGKAESLNVSAACSAALMAWRLQTK